MAYFPFFIDIKNKKCLIVGGGEVAYRKIRSLIDFGCHIYVVSPNISEKIWGIGGISIEKRGFLESDLDGCFMVIAATNDVGTNRFIAKIARERDIHVNVVDLNDQCSFYFPSVYKNGSICIGITTEGKSPGIAAVLREKIEECIPEFYGDMADRMGELRQNIKEKFTSQNKRREILGTILKKMVETNNNITDEEIQRLIEGYYED